MSNTTIKFIFFLYGTKHLLMPQRWSGFIPTGLQSLNSDLLWDFLFPDKLLWIPLSIYPVNYTYTYNSA
jgi:hypothetical protein